MNEQDTNTPEPIEQPAESPQEVSTPAPNDSIVDALTSRFNEQMNELRQQIEQLNHQVSERDKTIKVLLGDSPKQNTRSDPERFMNALGLTRRDI